jgi:hypothetical protein
MYLVLETLGLCDVVWCRMGKARYCVDSLFCLATLLHENAVRVAVLL